MIPYSDDDIRFMREWLECVCAINNASRMPIDQVITIYDSNFQKTIKEKEK